MDPLNIELLMQGRLAMLDDKPLSDLAPHLYDTIIQPADKALICYTLRRLNGNQVQAARILGLNRNTLRKRMKAHGLLQPLEMEQTP